MIEVSRTFFWHWKPSVHRLHFGLDFYVPGIKIRVGHDGPPCRVCRKREGIISWALDNPGAAICPTCCEHPDYEYERGDQDYFCVECGESAPYEWIDGHCSCDDDVCISFASSRDPDEPLGTPISQLSGCPVGPLHPDRPKYDRFVAIAKSWGYD
ncbi:hypothetical protein FHX08_002038 [Rhizobium sp. BK529]|uniref:hypothetical protein n=1 Tax=Rhizobium sp. BK529 TaxID=2586983 RepID=UPI001622E521|nr:hypothetical protein [Rhizobium sp. BK529]MBB3591694.1 hypothetical protein [Rhizobium sp. BK529]